MSKTKQSIVPFLWFEHQAEEAVNVYTKAFENSRIARVTRYGEAGPGPKGSVMSVDFELAGQEFYALNGGPQFTFSPAISFFVNCATHAELDGLWNTLANGGAVMMPVDAYPFSERFGWLQDRFGVSWQLNLGERDEKIAPFLMFIGENHGKAEEAVNFYCSLFDDAHIISLERYGAGEPEPKGTVKHAVFTLEGREFMAIDNSFKHPFIITSAISFFVKCDTQARINRLWDTLSEGGAPQQCGWIKDKYGVMWQIVPPVLGEMLNDKDPVKSRRVMEAMFKMVKLDIAGLKRAYEQR
jgi:predicted 3-demethylubiquinone-9 3-methyltransferase (glyoxalase superfamily)